MLLSLHQGFIYLNIIMNSLTAFYEICQSLVYHSNLGESYQVAFPTTWQANLRFDLQAIPLMPKIKQAVIKVVIKAVI